MLDGFQEWMRSRHPNKPNILWTALVLDEAFGAERPADDRNLGGSDQQSIERLCMLLRSFLSDDVLNP